MLLNKDFDLRLYLDTIIEVLGSFFIVVSERVFTESPNPKDEEGDFESISVHLEL